MKKSITRNLKTKLIAAAIALTSMASTTTVVMSSAINRSCLTASAADAGVIGEMVKYDYTDPTQKLAFQSAKKYGIQYLDKGLTELLKNVPFGDTIKNLVKDQLLSVFGLQDEKPITMKDLSDKIDNLDKKIEQAFDDQTKKLVKAMETNFTAGTYKSDLKSLADSEEVISIIKGDDTVYSKYNLSEEDKLVKLAMVIGNNNEWATSGSFIMEYTKVTNDMLGKNYISNDDIFTALYNHEKDKYMFSGEVIDAIEPYIQQMILDYMRYTTLALASLDAQEALLSDDFDASKITDKQIKRQYELFTNDLATIESAKIAIAKNVFGSAAFTQNGISIPKSKNIKLQANNYDNILDHYANFMSMNRLIHVPTGKVLSPTLGLASGETLIDDDVKKTEQFGLDCKESSTKEEFEKRITGATANSYNHNCFNVEEMKKLFAHVESQIASKKYKNVNDYLKKVGFNVDDNWVSQQYTLSDNKLALGTWFVTGGGYEETNYSVGFTGTDYKCNIDVVDLNNGKIVSKRWRNVQNNTLLIGLVNGDKVFCYGDYLTFHLSNDPGKQESEAIAKKKAEEANKKAEETRKLAAALIDNFNFYYESYPDLQAAFGHDTNKLAEHFANHGLDEGRQFSKYFNLDYYLDHNPDVKEAFGGDYAQTLKHFVDWGVYEGRSSSEYYDDKYYAETYPDVAGLSPYERFMHFLTQGVKEGRTAVADQNKSNVSTDSE